jgi:cytochrome c oxidase assembly protein subunit 15
MNDPTATPAWLRRFTKLVATATLFLIFAGAMVTSTGSGLAVPDWPLAYGMLFPPMIAGIFYEHGHRLIAGTVGFLTVIQALWLQRREPKRHVRILGWTSLGAVIAQGLLGGLTVKLLLPPIVSIAHAGLAEIFLCLNVSIAFCTSAFAAGTLAPRSGERGALSLPKGRVRGDATLRALPILVYLQILAGALMRHLGAGLAIPDFPTSMGRLVPRFTSTAIAVNYAHRVGGLLVALAVIVSLVAMFRSGAAVMRRMGTLLAAVVALQIYLGARIVWDGAGDARLYHSLVGDQALALAKVTSLHVMTGAATLAISLLCALTAGTLARRSETRPATRASFDVTDRAATASAVMASDVTGIEVTA